MQYYMLSTSSAWSRVWSAACIFLSSNNTISSSTPTFNNREGTCLSSLPTSYEQIFQVTPQLVFDGSIDLDIQDE